MKLNKNQIRRIIFEELARMSYASKEQGFTYGLDHVINRDKAANDIIGHT